jgi:hypothetical protein
MRLIAAGCLLVVLVAAAQAADSAPQLFVDFLSAASSSSTPAAAAGEAQARIASAAAEPAAYYEEVETHVACLREVGFKNCRSILGWVGTTPCAALRVLLRWWAWFRRRGAAEQS